MLCVCVCLYECMCAACLHVHSGVRARIAHVFVFFSEWCVCVCIRACVCACMRVLCVYVLNVFVRHC